MISFRHPYSQENVEEGDLGLGGDASDGRAGTGYQRGYIHQTRRLHPRVQFMSVLIVFDWYINEIVVALQVIILYLVNIFIIN